jgi:hypothetical protein
MPGDTTDGIRMEDAPALCPFRLHNDIRHGKHVGQSPLPFSDTRIEGVGRRWGVGRVTIWISVIAPLVLISK